MNTQAGIQRARNLVSLIHIGMVTIYGLVAVFCALALSFGFIQFSIISIVIYLAVPIALLVAHFKTANALKNSLAWGRTASLFLAVTMLVAFPIGTILALIVFSQMLKKQWYEKGAEDNV